MTGQVTLEDVENFFLLNMALGGGTVVIGKPESQFVDSQQPAARFFFGGDVQGLAVDLIRIRVVRRRAHPAVP